MSSSSSPLATGGAGVEFETDVGALYLVALLVGGPACGLPSGAVVEVRFQQSAQGAPLDDLVISAEGPDGIRRLDLQIKRRLSFASTDPEFASIVEKMWETCSTPSFGSPGNRLGVGCASFPRYVRDHYCRVPDWARSSSSAADFFARIRLPGLAHEKVRQFVDSIRQRVRELTAGEAGDEQLWTLFRKLALIEFDVQLEASSRDRAAALESLRWLAPKGSPEQAIALWDRLRDAVRVAKQSAGGYTAETLRSYLVGYGMEFRASPIAAPDLLRLEKASQRVLTSIETRIGRLELSRSALVSTVLSHLGEGRPVVLLGGPGNGKSAVLKAAGEARLANGALLVVSDQRLEGVAGWEGLAERWQVRTDLDDLVLAMSGVGRPSLLIDGTDRIESTGARQAVNDLLRAIGKVPAMPDGSRRWGIAITAREVAFEAVRQWLAIPAQELQIVRVEPFSEDEVADLGRELPHLQWVITHKAVSEVLRSPYFLHVLEQARTDLGGRGLVTEVDVHEAWWNQVIGHDLGRDRQQAMLCLGEQVLRHPTRRLLATGLDVNAVRSLEMDGVLRRDPDADGYWFGHDIIEEWTVARVLLQQADLLNFLHQHDQPFRVYRPLQFLACLRLERAKNAHEWRALLELAERDPTRVERWFEAILAAPLRSARADQLLEAVSEVYLEGEAPRLRVLLRVLRTEYIVPWGDDLAALLFPDLPHEEISSLALESAYPQVSTWSGALRWLVPRLSEIPKRARDEASRVMAIWQGLPGEADAPFRRELAEIAMEWRWLPSGDTDRVYVPSESRPYFDRLRDVVISAADKIPERIPGFLRELRQTDSEYEVDRWLAGPPPMALVRHAAHTYVDFVLDALVPKRQGEKNEAEEDERSSLNDWREEDSEWEDPHTAFMPASHLRGPFLSLLNANEAEGLRLVRALVRGAMAVRRHKAIRHGASLRRVPLRFWCGEIREFWGDPNVFTWFRPCGGAPYPVCCALMALEVWMEQQVERGREPRELFELVIGESESLGMIGACVAITLAYPEKCLRAAEPFISSWIVWDYDLARFVADRSSSFSLSHMFGGPDFFERAAQKRNDRPQRRREIRELVGRCVLFGDEDLRERVVRAIHSFPDDLSCFTEEERGDPEIVEAHRARMANYVAQADQANYRTAATQEGTQLIWYEAPAELQARNAPALEQQEKWAAALSLQHWGLKAQEGSLEEGTAVAEALRCARDLCPTPDFTRPLSWAEFARGEELRAIALVAAGATHLEAGMVAEDREWCKRILTAASKTPRRDDHPPVGLLPADLWLSAASGLTAMSRQGFGDRDTRQGVLRLLRSNSSQVLDAIFKGVREAWEHDPILCRNAVARELALGVLPERRLRGAEDEDSANPREAAVDTIERRFEDAIASDRIEIIGLSVPAQGQSLDVDRVFRALSGVPLEKIADGSELPWVFAGLQTALAWTLSQLRPVDGRAPRRYELGFPSQWPHLLGDWLARIAGYLPPDAASRQILEPLRSNWPASAAVISGVMTGYLAFYLVRESIPEWARRHWLAIANWILPAEPLASGRWSFKSEEELECLGLLVYVRQAQSLLRTEWRGMAGFLDLYDRWVAACGHNHWGFRTLLVFLRANSAHLPPGRVLDWLSSAVEGSTDKDRLWNESGTGRSAAELLSKLWSTGRDEMLRDQASLRRFEALVDELAQAGVALAAQLRLEI